MSQYLRKSVGCILAALLISGVAHARQNTGPVKVFVSVLPQKHFVERVGGDRVQVDVLVMPGESPATYLPKPSRVASLAAADLYFRIGVPFEEHLLPKVKSFAKGLKIVDTRAGVPLREMEGEHHHDEDDHHGHDDHHDHEGTDPHIWLDPMRVKIQAKTIRDALITQDPAGKEVYTKGYADFARELDLLHQELTQVLAPLKGSALYVFHPAFGYFADAYGLKQKAVEVQGKRPKGKFLAQFIQQARHDGARVIFVQPQFDRNTAGKIAHSIGGTVIPLDPLSPDYLNNLRKMARDVAESISSQ